ncbi:ParB/RepB/Spo0J family partition protein [Actinomadura sp. 1N219]|uniref:ParB/RepB/Spo0J family partition protein n=1 Tax=Actinomadura sp. 1N219 TaxID=3375152 RepID=UPI003789F236
MVPIAALTYADSPRLDGEQPEHVRVLAGMDNELPPILVHRQTMTVLDGMHRLRAAVQNGRTEIGVRFFDGTQQDAFVAAVKANIGHGLPLSTTDREAATVRILASHPRWSDRSIAEVVGLAATTVARIRARTTAVRDQPEARIGRDGRVRPINGAAGRRLAARLFAERPGASLREIAEQAGISPATALDVRERLGRGDDPVPDKQLRAEQRDRAAAGGTVTAGGTGAFRRHRRAPDAELALRKLQRDPSLRLTDAGRGLLRMLSTRSLRAQEWSEVQGEIPAHCVPLVADLALSCADEWARFAEALKTRARSELA